MFGADQRSQNIEKLASEEFDIFIIGGGITGAGVARDGAMRGLKVGLVEGKDFASGTSSRSSKLVHGGIRYLENLEFGLVHEALVERRNLFAMAPHLVHPLRFVLPLYEGGRVGMFKMGLGMWLYDILAMFEMPELHERWGHKLTKKKMPMLRSNGLLGSYVYSDAYMDDDRLVIETMRSADRAGAVAANHVRAVGSKLVEGQLKEVTCRDEVTGKVFSVKAKHFVSTVGPWTDDLGETLLGKWDRLMRPSKGIHFTLDRNRLPLREAVVLASDDEKRIIFGIPRHEMIIIGTTDTDFDEDPGDVYSTKEDVEYLLKIVADYFPGASLTKDDIIASYAGVRPLVHDGSTSESATSREHLILSDERNMTFVTGGKYTTYRHMAEETIERVLQSFTLEDQVKYGRCFTNSPLNPLVTNDDLLKSLKQKSRWAKETGALEYEMEFFVSRHGMEAEAILNKHLGSEKFDLWRLEARHAIAETMCINLSDFYLRRSPLFLARQDHGLGFIDSISNEFAQAYGWSKEEVVQQKRLLMAHIERELGWKSSLQD